MKYDPFLSKKMLDVKVNPIKLCKMSYFTFNFAEDDLSNFTSNLQLKKTNNLQMLTLTVAG